MLMVDTEIMKTSAAISVCGAKDDDVDADFSADVALALFPRHICQSAMDNGTHLHHFAVELFLGALFTEREKLLVFGDGV